MSHLVEQLGDEAWLEGKTGIAIEHYTSEVVRRQRNQRRRRGEADSYDHARAILVLRVKIRLCRRGRSLSEVDDEVAKHPRTRAH